MSIDLSHDGDGVATVLMNRPQKRNAFTLDMYREFGRVMRELEADDAVRCVVLRGAGGAFCAGSDIGGFADERDGAAQAAEYAAFTLSMTGALKQLRHPAVACIEGVCVGGGLELAAMCDIRVAGRGSRYGIPVNRIGLTVDHQELVELMDLIGAARALEILLEGHIFGAEEALSKGLLSRIVDDERVVEHAYATALRIAAAAPLVNRWHKRFVAQLRQGRALSPAERAEAYACFATEDYRRGREAFARKQVPEFIGR
ncbi:enoyl-CoA hydratase/isomerase family protein [Achromobacter sp. Marseille-Q0513]|uniref:enoyl-CoA hydratase/isomerase family protein n=1 Tax=Achromobacter sp. Marseille-Q0513 TaxID=2829161 RepID=UPI001B9DF751|nr:enoyl-CoA hydratase-related protein [Achromobacter sp. Marseille-Q0513]MBR8655515.1 enoyl-CoA hydratase/isomerase family protein [Achromobacter sp. Marseille-Q0513]